MWACVTANAPFSPGLWLNLKELLQLDLRWVLKTSASSAPEMKPTLRPSIYLNFPVWNKFLSLSNKAPSLWTTAQQKQSFSIILYQTSSSKAIHSASLKELQLCSGLCSLNEWIGTLKAQRIKHFLTPSASKQCLAYLHRKQLNADLFKTPVIITLSAVI